VCLACKKPSAKCALWHAQSLLPWPRGRWGYEWRSGNRLRSRRSNLERTPNARRLWLLALITVGHRYHSNLAPQCEQMHASSLNGVAKFSIRRQANEPCDICIPGIAHEFRGDGFAQFRPRRSPTSRPEISARLRYLRGRHRSRCGTPSVPHVGQHGRDLLAIEKATVCGQIRSGRFTRSSNASRAAQDDSRRARREIVICDPIVMCCLGSWLK
jgi:hypothetical protein